MHTVADPHLTDSCHSVCCSGAVCPLQMGRIYIDATSASSFHCPARRVAKWVAPRFPVFHYDWNYLPTASDTRWTGLAEHSIELGIVFFYGGSAEDEVMSAQVQNYIHRFLVHRSVERVDASIDGFYAPTYGNRTLVQWPRFQVGVRGGDRTMHLQVGEQHLVVRQGVHADQCDELWDWVVPHPKITPRRLPPVQQRLTPRQRRHRAVEVR